MVDADSILLLRTLILADVSATGLTEAGERDSERIGRKLYFAGEHPEDPEEYLGTKGVESDAHYPSIWTWPELESFRVRHGCWLAAFHQGMLGHPKVKPTKMIVTSGFLWERLHHLKVPKGELWSPKDACTLEDRIADSSSWSQWAPQLVEFIKDSLVDWAKGPVHAERQDQERKVRLEHVLAVQGRVGCISHSQCMRSLSSKAAEQFRQHCLAGHRPWRADCAACLDAMAFTKPHRRLARSRVCTLSFDVSGPHKSIGAEDQDTAKPKYFMVGCYTFPVFDDTSIKPKDAPPEGKIPDEDEAEAILRDHEPEGSPAPAQEWEIPEVDEPKGVVSEHDKAQARDEKAKWDAIIAGCKENRHQVVEIPLIEILPAKTTKAILGALNRFYAKLRAWGLPIYRLHSDCAREYTSDSIKQWAAYRGMYKTTTIPEHPAGNGRTERLVRKVKIAVRALLHSSGAPPKLWPHAARFAVEGMQRQALARLGHEVKELVPFHTLVRFRARTWRDSTWGSRSAEGRVVAPSTDVSKGYIVRVMDGETPRLYATTLMYQGFRPVIPDHEIDVKDQEAPQVFPTNVEMGRPVPKGYDEIPLLPEVVNEARDRLADRETGSGRTRIAGKQHVQSSPCPREQPAQHVQSSPCPREQPVQHVQSSPCPREQPAQHVQTSPFPREHPVQHVQPSHCPREHPVQHLQSSSLSRESSTPEHPSSHMAGEQVGTPIREGDSSRQGVIPLSGDKTGGASSVRAIGQVASPWSEMSTQELDTHAMLLSKVPYSPQTAERMVACFKEFQRRSRCNEVQSEGIGHDILRFGIMQGCGGEIVVSSLGDRWPGCRQLMHVCTETLGRLAVCHGAALVKCQGVSQVLLQKAVISPQ